MKLKVCGMREKDNIGELLLLKPDFIGFIFYAKSPRFVGSFEIPKVPKETKKVGVFVNEDESVIMGCVEKHGLDYAQLHGNESVELAKSLKQKGVGVIKVFGVMDAFPNEEIRPYEDAVDYFLFDTKTPAHGGSGEKFDWSILKSYDSPKPFFLSGGIDVSDLEEIKKMNIEKLEVIDVNSRFEIAPGLKDIEKVKALKKQL
ncbi:MAG: phosphoribosylanthranilate isomerase [Cyclobacteriaceae bacterium]